MKTLKKIGEEACNNTYCDRCRCDLKAIEGGSAIIKEIQDMYMSKDNKLTIEQILAAREALRSQIDIFNLTLEEEQELLDEIRETIKKKRRLRLEKAAREALLRQ